jgi:hypothetical protein
MDGKWYGYKYLFTEQFLIHEKIFIIRNPTPDPSRGDGRREKTLGISENTNYFGIGWAIGSSNPKIIGFFLYENDERNICAWIGPL